MAFINNLRWRNFGLCAKVSMYRAGTSDRVFQQRGGFPLRRRGTIFHLANCCAERGTVEFTRAFRIGRRAGARTPFKGRSTNIGFPFSRESQTAWHALRFLFTNTHGAAVVDMKKGKRKKKHKRERVQTGSRSQQEAVRLRHGKAIGIDREDEVKSERSRRKREYEGE